MSLEKIKETIFAYDKEVIDCEVLRAKNIDVIHSKIYFHGILLIGANELPNNPLYFGELDIAPILNNIDSNIIGIALRFAVFVAVCCLDKKVYYILYSKILEIIMDTIKSQINKLKDYAELRQASYFYFDF